MYLVVGQTASLGLSLAVDRIFDLVFGHRTNYYLRPTIRSR